MHNYKLTIQYDGSQFHGWQIQKNALSVQQIIEDKLSIIFREKVQLQGSGRTDTGVHALGQVANFKSIIRMKKEKLSHSLNSMLPDSISIVKVEKEYEKFHSRHYAKDRSYIYLFIDHKSPFYNKFAAFDYNSKKWDVEKLNIISKEIIGKKDFTTLCKLGSSAKDMICDVSEIHWRRNGNLLIFYITANRFLRGMVRLAIGSILEAYQKDDPKKYLNDILETRDNKCAGKAVPPEGLYLYKVRY